MDQSASFRFLNRSTILNELVASVSGAGSFVVAPLVLS